MLWSDSMVGWSAGYHLWSWKVGRSVGTYHMLLWLLWPRMTQDFRLLQNTDISRAWYIPSFLSPRARQFSQAGCGLDRFTWKNKQPNRQSIGWSIEEKGMTYSWIWRLCGIITASGSWLCMYNEQRDKCFMSTLANEGSRHILSWKFISFQSRFVCAWIGNWRHYTGIHLFKFYDQSWPFKKRG